MKAADVKIGEIYLTYVSGALRKVRVLRTTTYGGRSAFVVQRPDESAPLPKPRTAAALRTIGAPKISGHTGLTVPSEAAPD